MALLDPQRGCIVLRAIYDGPAFAGKTTNLRSLAQSLGADIYSGGEADGRTLYFDWVDYVGGLFEGMPIRCQIVGVPGQRVLEGRRRLLLETADVVVFVADSRPEQLAENVRSFDVLRRVISPATPPLGIVVQANKRDLEEAVTLETLRDALDGATSDSARSNSTTSLAMTEAVASRGDGVRETFVLAVRLALDRVRELWDRNALPKLTPDIDDGPQLLSAVQAAEMHELEDLSSLSLAGPDRRTPLEDAQPQSRNSSSPQTSGPPFPEASVPPGFVWPPVEGRVVMHEAGRVAPHLERCRSGDWIGSSREWKLRAPLEGLFFDLETARASLVDWARWHAAAGARLSGPRGIVLVPEAADVWRLWQIVRRVPTLRDTTRELFAQSDDVLLGEGLFRILNLRLRAERDLISGGWLGRLTLDSVGVSDRGEPLFTDFSPYPGGSSCRVVPAKIDGDQILRAELGPLVRRELQRTPRRIPAVLASLRNTAEANDRCELADSIQQVLLGS